MSSMSNENVSSEIVMKIVIFDEQAIIFYGSINLHNMCKLPMQPHMHTSSLLAEVVWFTDSIVQTDNPNHFVLGTEGKMAGKDAREAERELPGQAPPPTPF